MRLAIDTQALARGRLRNFNCQGSWTWWKISIEENYRKAQTGACASGGLPLSREILNFGNIVFTPDF
jgi:hypothetical protein